jgi:hypothetical protein
VIQKIGHTQARPADSLVMPSLSTYLESLQQYTAIITVPGLDVASEPIPFETVFVEPQLYAHASGKRRWLTEPGAMAEQSAREAPPAEPAHSVLEQQPRLVILGEPGQGKSTLVRQYVRVVGGTADGRLPLLVEFGQQREKSRLIDEPYGWLRERLPAALRQALGESGWEEMCGRLDAGRACIVLDGFDELTREAQSEAHGLIETLAGNQVILTSRPHAYRLMPLREFKTYALADLRADQVRGLATNVCAAVAKEYHVDLFEPALEKVLETASGRASSMSRNPLFLSFMCLTAVRKLGAAELERFPTRPAPLVGECVDALVEWHRVHKHSATWPPHLLGAEVMKILAPLALETFTSGSGLVKQKAIADLDEEMKSIVLEHLVQARFLEQRDADYAFPLETFREYHAALAVAAARDPFAEVRDHLHDPAWEKVIVYAGGCLQTVAASWIDLALPALTPAVKWIDPLTRVAGKMASQAMSKVPNVAQDPEVVKAALELIGPALQEPLERWLVHSRRSAEFFVRAVLAHGCRYDRLLGRDVRLAARCLPGLLECPNRSVRRVCSRFVRQAAVFPPGSGLGRVFREALAEAATAPPVRKVVQALVSRSRLGSLMIQETLNEVRTRDSSSHSSAVRDLPVPQLPHAAALMLWPVRKVLRALASGTRELESLVFKDTLNEVRTHDTWPYKRAEHSLQVSTSQMPHAAALSVLSPYGGPASRPQPLSERANNEAFLLRADASEPADRERLLQVTREPHPGVRRDAVEKLRAAINEPSVRARLIEMTEDVSDVVREAAVSALGKAAREGVVQQRLLMLLQDPEPNICTAAAHSLTRSGAEAQALELLLTLTRHLEPKVRAGAASALTGVAQDRRVQRRLRQLTRDVDDEVRTAALAAIRGWGGGIPRSLLWRLALIVQRRKLTSRLFEWAYLLTEQFEFEMASVSSAAEAAEAALTLEIVLQMQEQAQARARSA